MVVHNTVSFVWTMLVLTLSERGQAREGSHGNTRDVSVHVVAAMVTTVTWNYCLISYHVNISLHTEYRAFGCNELKFLHQILLLCKIHSKTLAWGEILSRVSTRNIVSSLNDLSWMIIQIHYWSIGFTLNVDKWIIKKIHSAILIVCYPYRYRNSFENWYFPRFWMSGGYISIPKISILHFLVQIHNYRRARIASWKSAEIFLSIFHQTNP